MRTIFDQQKNYFLTDKTKSYDFRIRQLTKLEEAIRQFEPQIETALKHDLNKSTFESYATEIGYCLNSIRLTKKHLKRWMQVNKVKTPLAQQIAKSYIKQEPLGTVLIIGPYNYPFQLVIEPLIGAIAAGNTAIVKPSEFASETETVVKAMINHVFESHYVHVFTGDKSVTQSLLEMPFDHIFFTGSTRVGQIVYEAASKQLIPVTLELGGKSPTIVDPTANIHVAARRIVFGKFINAGQTCIAPDYLIVHDSVKSELIQALRSTINSFYHNQKDDYARLINQTHYDRIVALIDEDKVVIGNHKNRDEKYISPTVLDRVSWDDPVMQEEIFGPVLPIISYTDLDDVIQTLKRMPKPLALYLFSEDKVTQEKVFEQLSFGNGAINQTILQVANPYLPFGGVGLSGIGNYHGKASFDCFSHQKSYIKKSTRFDPTMAYPPYDDDKLKWIKRFLK